MLYIVILKNMQFEKKSRRIKDESPQDYFVSTQDRTNKISIQNAVKKFYSLHQNSGTVNGLFFSKRPILSSKEIMKYQACRNGVEPTHSYELPKSTSLALSPVGYPLWSPHKPTRVRSQTLGAELDIAMQSPNLNLIGDRSPSAPTLTGYSSWWANDVPLSPEKKDKLLERRAEQRDNRRTKGPGSV
jgi:hypothetical protein